MAKLTQTNFEDIVSRRGVNVLWQRAQRCTCWRDESGQPNYQCKACRGFGYLYDAPVAGNHILVMNLALNKEFTQLGEYRMGDCVASISKRLKLIDPVSKLWEYPPNPLYDLGEWDRITLQNSEFLSHDVVLRGEDLRNRDADTLRNDFATTILRIVQANEQTGAVTTFTPATYELVGNRVDWLASPPPTGSAYSVLYYHRPTYVVYTQLPQSRDQDDQHFPKKVILRYRDAL